MSSPPTPRPVPWMEENGGGTQVEHPVRNKRKTRMMQDEHRKSNDAWTELKRGNVDRHNQTKLPNNNKMFSPGSEHITDVNHFYISYNNIPKL